MFWKRCLLSNMAFFGINSLNFWAVDCPYLGWKKSIFSLCEFCHQNPKSRPPKVHQKLNGTESQRIPDQVSCDRAIRYSGLGVRETWVLLEISWIKCLPKVPSNSGWRPQQWRLSKSDPETKHVPWGSDRCVLRDQLFNPVVGMWFGKFSILLDWEGPNLWRKNFKIFP